MDDLPNVLISASTWIIPLLLAIPLHEAAHGYAARFFGDNTAYNLGRVTMNPLKHVDPMGTLILPGLLFIGGSPVLFGWAKPVPVNFGNLRNPRRDMVWVAAAGPAINLAMAIAAVLLLHFVVLAPGEAQDWIFRTLVNALILNVVLAVFNMIPLPPLDGGRVAVGLLPDVLAYPLARLERYGMFIILALLLLPPLLGGWFAANLNILGEVIHPIVLSVSGTIFELLGPGLAR